MIGFLWDSYDLLFLGDGFLAANQGKKEMNLCLLWIGDLKSEH